ncbi:MAG TPA: thermonuclease family protein [Thermoanaerobaculia bacterium]|jgi:endonuclease YncB( thermonuclease family)|nr:thermonuclease family protein [Thermoanaerobaculia bacterium]
MRKFLVALAALTALGFAPIAVAGGTMMKVLSIVNGNTIKADVRGKEMQIRLLGIATPDPDDDTHPILKQLGVEARDFLNEFTKSHFVYGEFPSGVPVPDKDGIADALLWGGSNSEFINEKILSEGFGVVDRQTQLVEPLRDQLIRAEDTAKLSRRGLRGSFSQGGGHDVASGKSHQATYLGVSPSSGNSRSSEVTYWIIIFQ